MSTVVFDTLKFAQTLRDKAKLSLEQAEGITSAFYEATGERLVTKVDLVALATKTDLAEIKSDILKWTLGMIGFQTIMFLGAVIALARLAH